MVLYIWTISFGVCYVYSALGDLLGYYLPYAIIIEPGLPLSYYLDSFFLTSS